MASYNTLLISVNPEIGILTGDPPTSQNLGGPCFIETTLGSHFDGFGDILNPSITIIEQVPCPGSFTGIGGVGIGNFGGGTGGGGYDNPPIYIPPLNQIKISPCNYTRSELDKNGVQVDFDLELNYALSEVLRKLNEIQKKLQGLVLICGPLQGDTLRAIMACLHNKSLIPDIDKILCTDLGGNRDGHFEFKSNQIFLDLMNMWKVAKQQVFPFVGKPIPVFRDLLQKEIMHEFIHSCGVDPHLAMTELDVQILNIQIWGDDIKYNNLFHINKFTFNKIVTENTYHLDDGPDKKIFGGNLFSWNKKTGEVWCSNNLASPAIRWMPEKSVVPWL